MASINKVILVGNLGRDPEVKHLNGLVVASLNVATTYKWKEKTTGEWREDTEWHRVSLYGKPAEVAEKYLKKGGSVYIEGRMKTRKWTDKNGQDRYITEVISEDMQMLGSSGSQPKQDNTADIQDNDIPF